MNTNEILFEITREDGVLTSAKIIMPTWSKTNDEGTIYISLPLLGENFNTIATSEEDADVAIDEAFNCFCLVAESHGKGLEKELEELGWRRKEKDVDSNKKHYAILRFNVKNDTMKSIARTGDSSVLSYKPKMALA